mmetsp:Transcript_41387/g.95603  ORF Transcript_41387/g.95603 Transcript_41387/m.95603 type:complete len:523 (+) Transcript_41387:65-1633(+)|eukprot:CAMPEP_0182573208 /NCGR_PEP_ID=MMETSP1324-20130603/18863_1 /TAXON_ID=236786 /ORGANISM="Florenciella sp., Strain RCC1587" /LENGTH=522 /DNA_ID=CAMNT_0024788279 /DNA_START=50 /DNA_END=1618 /DNA_ORIENTATION=+
MAPASTPLLMPQLAPSPFPFPLVSGNMFPMMPKEKTYRKGKWLKEEEDYALMLISHFKSGHLKDEPTSGVTLRAYLAERLDCEPMRITKKFNGDASIGKHLYVPATSRPGGVSDESLCLALTSSHKALAELQAKFVAQISDSVTNKQPSLAGGYPAPMPFAFGAGIVGGGGASTKGGGAGGGVVGGPGPTGGGSIGGKSMGMGMGMGMTGMSGMGMGMGPMWRMPFANFKPGQMPFKMPPPPSNNSKSSSGGNGVSTGAGMGMVRRGGMGSGSGSGSGSGPRSPSSVPGAHHFAPTTSLVHSGAAHSTTEALAGRKRSMAKVDSLPGSEQKRTKLSVTPRSTTPTIGSTVSKVHVPTPPVSRAPSPVSVISSASAPAKAKAKAAPAPVRVSAKVEEPALLLKVKATASKKRARPQPTTTTPTVPAAKGATVVTAKDEAENAADEEDAPRVTKIPSVGMVAGAGLLLDFISAVNTQVGTGGDHEAENKRPCADEGKASPRTSNDGASSPASALMAPDMMVCVM